MIRWRSLSFALGPDSPVAAMQCDLYTLAPMRIRRKSLQDVQGVVVLPRENAEIALCPFGLLFIEVFARRRALT